MSTLVVNSIVNSNSETRFSPTIANTTPITLSGTTVDVTGIPSWVRRVTVYIVGQTVSGTSNRLLQLGTVSAFTITGYSSTSIQLYNTNSVAGTNYTTGFGIKTDAGSNDPTGTITLVHIGSNVWVCNYMVSLSGPNSLMGGGKVTLSDTLTRIRLTTVNGTDTFTAGTCNVIWE